MEVVSFIVAKIYYGISALFGGLVLSFFWKPERFKRYTPVAAGAIIGGISVGSGVIFGGALAIYLGMNPNDANTALALGGAIGISAVGILSWIANTFDKCKDKDILEVAQELRGNVSAPAAQEAPAVPAKKTVRRKRAGEYKL
jgi:Na+(H+)/acetate symporter ActP